MDPELWINEAAVIAGAYALGCLTAGFYLFRWLARGDLRRVGSGTVGARNAGRFLGTPGFLATFTLDFLKGFLAVWLAQHAGARPTAVVIAMLAVVAGHIWPVQLRGHGGKGVATGLGAMASFDPAILACLMVLMIPALAILRSLTWGGMLALAMLPLLLSAAGFPLATVFGFSGLAVLIVFAHRRKLVEEAARWFEARSMKQPSKPQPHFHDS